MTDEPGLDDLSWPAGGSFISHGVRVGVRISSPDPDLLGQLTGCLPPGWKAARSPVVDRLYSVRVVGAGRSSSGGQLYMLYAGPVKLAWTPSLDGVLDALEFDLRLYVAETARRRVFVHAGVVGWHGRALLLPGRSFSGKTTLVAALVRAGATYYSDEYAVLDARGRVHPYSMPLSIRERGETQGTRCPPERLGGRSGTQPLPVGLVAVSEYRPGARWRPNALSPAQAVLALLANTVPARSRPAAALETLQRAVAQATTLRGIRGEAEETVDALLSDLAL